MQYNRNIGVRRSLRFAYIIGKRQNHFTQYGVMGMVMIDSLVSRVLNSINVIYLGGKVSTNSALSTYYNYSYEVLDRFTPVGRSQPLLY